jgi:4-diphosphocytidyl-2-C-methyl-D-erythritol kinase
MLRASAHAKVNLSLVVGPRRADGQHELVTVVEKLSLADTVTLERADALRVEGFDGDTLVSSALTALAARAGVEPGFSATIEKRIPVAAGLGGGSSDAAAALVLGNTALGAPLATGALLELAATVGADVPLFLVPGPVRGTGDGTTVSPLPIPRDYHVVLWLPDGEEKASTAEVYARFDDRDGATGFAGRVEALVTALDGLRVATDLAALPPNDLASSPRSREVLALGAFRADVSGAGPALYGLFADPAQASEAARALRPHGRTWLATPARDG